ncbi:DUF6400 family protein [Streptosporangium sp. NPDC001681]|uniref:DUF6400 family protein n=1 Tax=Streptosporangium sp. NPDC001681 TaxID=3154395 RepID=UPI0033278207
MIAKSGPAQAEPGHISGAAALPDRSFDTLTSRPGSHVMSQDSASPYVDFEIDLTLEETRRRAAVMAALEPDWDPPGVLRAEEEAYDLLYSGLDSRQQEIYDMLVAAGVLPPRESGRAA